MRLEVDNVNNSEEYRVDRRSIALGRELSLDRNELWHKLASPREHRRRIGRLNHGEGDTDDRAIGRAELELSRRRTRRLRRSMQGDSVSRSLPTRRLPTGASRAVRAPA
eukprot:scaffold292233_cov30-Tisochrysis_lutea.AAC.2